MGLPGGEKVERGPEDNTQACLAYGEQAGFLVAQYASRFELCLVNTWLGQGDRGLAWVQPLLPNLFSNSIYIYQYLFLLCKAYIIMERLPVVEALFETVYKKERTSSMFKHQYDWTWFSMLFAQGKYTQVVESIGLILSSQLKLE